MRLCLYSVVQAESGHRAQSADPGIGPTNLAPHSPHPHSSRDPVRGGADPTESVEFTAAGAASLGPEAGEGCKQNMASVSYAFPVVIPGNMHSEEPGAF